MSDSQQVIKQRQILRVGVGNPVAHSVTGGLSVQIIDAGGRTQQPRHGMNLTGVVATG